MSVTDKGRMTTVKDSLMAKILTVIPTATVIDEWKLDCFDWDSLSGILFAVRIAPSPTVSLNYGMAGVNGNSGQYQNYRITMWVFAALNDAAVLEGDTSEELKEDTAENPLQQLMKYLRLHGEDKTNGVLYYEEFSARETDASKEKGAFVNKLLVEFTIVCERPYRVTSK